MTTPPSLNIISDASKNAFAEMPFSIEKSTVTAKSRLQFPEYTMNSLKTLCSNSRLDAETELANILSSEILLR